MPALGLATGSRRTFLPAAAANQRELPTNTALEGEVDVDSAMHDP